MNYAEQIEQQVGVENASEEEQAQYEQAYELAMRSLHSGKTAQNTVGRVLNAKSTSSGVAQAVFVLLRRTEVQLKGMDDSVKMQLAEDLVQEVLELMAESERLQESEITDQLIEDIVKELYVIYTQDAEDRGALDENKIREDVESGQHKPQGYAAMSNKEAQARGLMDV